MTYKLMIKTHNLTGLKYLCITKRANWQDYLGSGTRWNRHLKKHGNDISTELLFESDDYSTFVEVCYYYSDLFDVANSSEFANVVPEYGYENDYRKPNIAVWWDYASDEEKALVYRKRSNTLKQTNESYRQVEYSPNKRNPKITYNHDPYNVKAKKLSKSTKTWWDSFSYEERVDMTSDMRQKSLDFFSDKESDEYKEYVEFQSQMMKNVWANRTEDEVKEIGQAISIGRLSMSDEDKQVRIEKIQKTYATGKHDALFEQMSEDRTGVGNPAAKIIVWHGENFTKQDFYKFIKDNGISKEDAEDILKNDKYPDCYKTYDDTEKKEYDIITCPHCNVSSNGNKPSSFKRWHFNNCKARIVENENGNKD